MSRSRSQFLALDNRRRKLGMSRAILAERSGVSLPTVQRILSGDHPTASFANVASVAEALGMEVQFEAKVEVRELREEQARKKAERLVGMVKGTSGLEGQALDQTTICEMVNRTVHELLAGPRRTLWEKL